MTAQEKLKKVRTDNQYSMNRMAALLSTSAPTYSTWEKSVRPPRRALECLSDLTGVSFSILDNDDLDLPDFVVLSQTKQTDSHASEALTDDDREQMRWQHHLNEQVNKIGTQGEFAELTGLDTAQLSKFLSGKKRITLRTMFKVASVTNNYAWYTPAPIDHQGQRLRDYLEFKGIEQQWLADQLGNVKSAISSLLARPDIKQSKWTEIGAVLGVTKEAVLSNLIPNENLPNETYEHNHDNSALKSRRVRSASTLLTQQYVSVRSIPGNLRAGFSYQKMLNQLSERQVSLSQFNRVNQLSQLTQQQIDAEVKRYDIIIIGNDHMEPGLRAGQEILSYRLYEDKDQVAYPVGRWSDESGPMAIETQNGRLFVGRVLDNTLRLAGSVTFVTDDVKGGSATFQLEQIVNIWKLETYIGGPVV